MSTRLIVVSPEELERIIRRAVAEALASSGRAGSDEWLPIRDVPPGLRTAVRAAIKRGELEARRCGRAHYVRRDALHVWIARHPSAGTDDPSANRKGRFVRKAKPDDPIDAALAAGRLRVANGGGR